MIETVPSPEEQITDKIPVQAEKELLPPVSNTFKVIYDGREYNYDKSKIKMSDEVKKGKSVLIPITIFFVAISIAGIFILYQGFTSPTINIAAFILSPSFDWFLITIVCIILLGPFGIYGIFKFYSWMQNEFFKSRSGHMKVRRKMSNDRWRIFWKKPIGNKIKAKTEDGIDIEIPIKLEKDWVGWEGNIPFIEFDENLNQMPLKRTIQTIPQEHSTRMSYLAYLAGKISAWKEQSNLQLLLVLAIIIIVGASVYNIWITMGIKEDQTKMTETVSKVERITGDLYNRTAPQTPTVNQVPTVS